MRCVPGVEVGVAVRIVLIAVGRMKAGPERDLLARYADRAQAMARSVGLTGVTIRDVEESRARQASERRRDEAVLLAREMEAGALVVALDERGRTVSSEEFATLVGRSRDVGTPSFILLIGGPDGLAEEARAQAHHCIGYGAATFPHQLVRVMAAEQVYRAMTILAGHPYHRA